MSDDKSKKDKSNDAEVPLDEVHFADIERSLIAICNGWESADTLSADDMVEHLEGAINVFEGVDDFHEFIKKTGLKIRNNS